MESAILKHLLPLALAGALSACAVVPQGGESAPGQAGGPVLQGQPGPPAPQLEHPGRPPATGHLWIAGHWNWSGSGYDWVPGSWVPPRRAHVWLPPVWRNDGQRWYLDGGRWEPDPNGASRSAEKRRS